MAHIVHVTRPGQIGDDPIDLDMCRRYEILVRDLDRGDEDDRTLYRSPCGTWVECVGRLHDPDRNPRWVLSYKVIDPVEAAHHILMRFKDLPGELEEHRGIASDMGRYRAWRHPKHEAPRKMVERINPTWDAKKRTLLLGAVVCRVYNRRADNQFLLLEAFEVAGWPSKISNPFNNIDKLHQMITDINKFMGRSSALRFYQDNACVSWKLTVL